MVQAGTGGPEHDAAPERRWLLSRIDRQCRESLDALLVEIVEKIATATGDAVGVRELSSDGARMFPVCSYHPDPGAASAIAALMESTVDVTTGVWSEVVERQETRGWEIDDSVGVPGRSGHLDLGMPLTPDNTVDPDLGSFVDRYRLRAALRVPLVDGGRVVGGLGLGRLGVGRGYTDRERALIEDCALRLGPILGLRRRVSGLAS